MDKFVKELVFRVYLLSEIRDYITALRINIILTINFRLHFFP